MMLIWIFSKQKKSDIECDEHNDNSLETCSALKWLIHGLKYYSLLNVTTDDRHKQIFINFVKCIYKKFLDDYNHFIQKHDKHLEHVNKSLIKDTSFGDCNVSKCKFATRHHEDRKNDSDTNDNNAFNGTIWILWSNNGFIVFLFVAFVRCWVTENTEQIIWLQRRLIIISKNK